VFGHDSQPHGHVVGITSTSWCWWCHPNCGDDQRQDWTTGSGLDSHRSTWTTCHTIGTATCRRSRSYRASWPHAAPSRTASLS